MWGRVGDGLTISAKLAASHLDHATTGGIRVPGASPTVEVSDDPDRKDLAARTDYTELVDILL